MPNQTPNQNQKKLPTEAQIMARFREMGTEFSQKDLARLEDYLGNTSAYMAQIESYDSRDREEFLGYLRQRLLHTLFKRHLGLVEEDLESTRSGKTKFLKPSVLKIPGPEEAERAVREFYANPHNYKVYTNAYLNRRDRERDREKDKGKDRRRDTWLQGLDEWRD
jgi:hypothetical protein